MTVSAYPLQWPAGWPRTPDHERQRAHFGAKSSSGYGRQQVTLAAATRRVMDQIRLYTRAGHPWRIDPDLVVVSTMLQIRKFDGLPRSGQRKPDDPGVAVYFQLDGQPVVLACDKWDRIEDNLVAVAKTLEAMRGMERWGVSDFLQRAFQGFAALPGPDTTTHWSGVLGVAPDASLADVKAAYMTLRSQHHPDRPGGDAQMFNRIQKAWEQAQEELG